MVFGRDGMVYLATGGNIGNVAQDPASLRGKILRLRDDGSVPDDNPFVGRQGYRPEIFTLGHRNTLALIVHPQTGEVWNSENGPNGGDEINIILKGRNYGWPVVSFGREYPGSARVRASDPRGHGIAARLVDSVDRRVRHGRLHRRSLPGDGRATSSSAPCAPARSRAPGTCSASSSTRRPRRLRRESMLTELRQRIREVRQGPDGLLYLLTDEDDGALLRIEPVP